MAPRGDLPCSWARRGGFRHRHPEIFCGWLTAVVQEAAAQAINYCGAMVCGEVCCG